MAVADVNKILRAYLITQTGITDLVGTRIFSPRLPENCDLPAISFFVRGGSSTPYIPDIPSPSIQIDCWANDPIDAREVYRKVYDALQGIEKQVVVIAPNTYYILSAIEETQGQDLQDVDIPGYYRCLTFFSIMFR